MQKNIFLLLVFVTAIAVVPAMAQDRLGILEVENSYIMGYSFPADDIAQTFRIGLNFKLSEAFEAGFIFQQAGTNYTSGGFLMFRYTLIKKLAFGLMIGNAGTAAAGVNISYALLSNEVKGLVTTMRLNLEYLMPNITSGSIEDGIFGISIGLAFGI
ncbi:MAG: hypothetical protein JW874_07390 [Spirochaetales bacterium]|nr:hypothetical protein [Spirochaetales bacterium]